jgi:hypothetical protein
MASRVEELYEQHIRTLSPAEQLRLVELIAREMATASQGGAPRMHSIMELHGLGAEIWESVDAQEYVNELRREWDHRP